jgi:Tol biopolymer transport system component
MNRCLLPTPPRFFIVLIPNDGTGAQIWLMNADGSNKVQLTNDPALCFHSPNISADGKLGIADAHDYSGSENNLYTMDLTTSVVTQLTSGNNPYEFPAISPDKTKIVLTAWDPGGGTNLASLNMDGSGLTMLTSTGKDKDGNFVGTRLVFHSNRDGNFELYSMKADGTDQKRLTNNDVEDVFDNFLD